MKHNIIKASESIVYAREQFNIGIIINNYIGQHNNKNCTRVHCDM